MTKNKRRFTITRKLSKKGGGKTNKTRATKKNKLPIEPEEQLYQEQLKEQLKEQQDRDKALKKVGTFILKNKSKLRTNYLKTICADSGACISFGTEVKKINELFDNFVNFEYAVSPIKSIGPESANGFINEIKYIRHDYESYADDIECVESFDDIDDTNENIKHVHPLDMGL